MSDASVVARGQLFIALAVRVRKVQPRVRAVVLARSGVVRLRRLLRAVEQPDVVLLTAVPDLRLPRRLPPSGDAPVVALGQRLAFVVRTGGGARAARPSVAVVLVTARAVNRPLALRRPRAARASDQTRRARTASRRASQRRSARRTAPPTAAGLRRRARARSPRTRPTADPRGERHYGW